MSMGESAYGCATPQGIMRLWHTTRLLYRGKHAVVVGRSPILGKPMAMMMLQANATVTICHSRTQDLAQHIARQMSSLEPLVGPSLLRQTGSKTARLLLTRAITRVALAISSWAHYMARAHALYAGARRRRTHDHQHPYSTNRGQSGEKAIASGH